MLKHFFYLKHTYFFLTIFLSIIWPSCVFCASSFQTKFYLYYYIFLINNVFYLLAFPHFWCLFYASSFDFETISLSASQTNEECWPFRSFWVCTGTCCKGIPFQVRPAGNQYKRFWLFQSLRGRASAAAPLDTLQQTEIIFSLMLKMCVPDPKVDLRGLEILVYTVGFDMTAYIGAAMVK